MTHKASVWLGAFAGLGLLLACWGAAPAARAQEAAQEAACSVFAELINSGHDLCLAEGCVPTETDCDRVCRNATRTCNAVTNSAAKAVDDLLKGEFKQQKTLCKTADDPKTCHSDSKMAKKAATQDLKQFKKDARQACKSGDLVDPCLDACNSGSTCSCVGPGPVLVCD